VQATTTRPRIMATTDGNGVVSHAGSGLLADVADAAGVPAALSDALAGLRERRSGHDPGRVLTDISVMLADGGEAISDLAVLRDQPEVFGPVASTATAWRVLDAIDQDALVRGSSGEGGGAAASVAAARAGRPRHPGLDRRRA
jgi:Transposase DDE domain group 1